MKDAISKIVVSAIFTCILLLNVAQADSASIPEAIQDSAKSIVWVSTGGKGSLAKIGGLISYNPKLKMEDYDTTAFHTGFVIDPSGIIVVYPGALIQSEEGKPIEVVTASGKTYQARLLNRTQELASIKIEPEEPLVALSSDRPGAFTSMESLYMVSRRKNGELAIWPVKMGGLMNQEPAMGGSYTDNIVMATEGKIDTDSGILFNEKGEWAGYAVKFYSIKMQGYLPQQSVNAITSSRIRNAIQQL